MWKTPANMIMGNNNAAHLNYNNKLVPISLMKIALASIISMITKHNKIKKILSR
jgi:hypothetical protein